MISDFEISGIFESSFPENFVKIRFFDFRESGLLGFSSRSQLFDLTVVTFWTLFTGNVSLPIPCPDVSGFTRSDRWASGSQWSSHRQTILQTFETKIWLPTSHLKFRIHDGASDSGTSGSYSSPILSGFDILNDLNWKNIHF